MAREPRGPRGASAPDSGRGPRPPPQSPVDDDCDGEIDEDGGGCNGLCCNGVCTPSSATDCGACGVACSAGMIVINELHIDPNAANDTVAEWFELHNPGAVALDLRGFVLRDLGADTHTITSAGPVWLPAGGLVVLGINATPATNGGVTLGYQYATLALGNAGDELIVQGFGTEFDRVVWPGTFDVLGSSKELSRSRQTAALNNTLTNWCTATVVFGAGDRGTPNAPNTCNL